MSASIEVRAPAEETEGTRSQLLRWLKQVGERVEANEPLIEIETDKVTVEVASPASGVLREILKHEQEQITPGELLARLEPAAGAAVASVSAAPAPAARANSSRRRARSLSTAPRSASKTVVTCGAAARLSSMCCAMRRRTAVWGTRRTPGSGAAGGACGAAGAGLAGADRAAAARSTSSTVMRPS